MSIKEFKNAPDWVDAEKGKVHISVFSQLRDFDEGSNAGYDVPTLKGVQQYTGRSIPSAFATGSRGSTDVNSVLATSLYSMNKINFNITAVIIDTLAAKLASIQAVPQAVTNKGNSKGRKLADDLNFLLKGIFHKYDATHLLNLAFKDAMCNRVGYIKLIKDDEGNVSLERIYANEVVIDLADGYYNKPYKMIHRKTVPIHVLKRQYPKYAKYFDEVMITEIRQHISRNYTPSIVIAESWCLNTYVKKGRHTLSVENVDIIDEEWDKDYFPILKCDYIEPSVGWQGSSLIEDLYTIQMEIDRLLITIQSICKLVSVPRVFVDSNSDVNDNHFTNEVGLIIKYDGKQGVAPVIHNGAAMPPELVAQLEFLINQAYARAGLTPMDTQGQQKQGSGNQSGEALKTMTDIKSERWQLLQHTYEHKHVELAQMILNELQGEKIKISALDRSIGLKEVSTKVIPKTRDSYVLKMFPVSSLPDSIPDKIDSVQQMLQLGVIQQSQVPDLFAMPDVDAKVSLLSAAYRLIDKKLEDMLDTGIYWAPEPFHNLDYAITCATQHYNWAQLNDEEDSKIALIRRFLNDVGQLKAQAAPVIPQPNQPVNAQPQQQGVKQ